VTRSGHVIQMSRHIADGSIDAPVASRARSLAELAELQARAFNPEQSRAAITSVRLVDDRIMREMTERRLGLPPDVDSAKVRAGRVAP